MDPHRPLGFVDRAAAAVDCRVVRRNGRCCSTRERTCSRSGRRYRCLRLEPVDLPPRTLAPRAPARIDRLHSPTRAAPISVCTTTRRWPGAWRRLPPLGVVGAFNAVSLAAAVLTGMAMFLRRGGFKLRPLSAVMVGALFIASPTPVSARRGAFQLRPGGGLPLFLWSLCVCSIAVAPAMRCSSARRRRSLYSDAYRDLIPMGTFVVGWRFTAVRWDGGGRRLRGALRGFDAVIVFTSAAIVWRLLHGPALLVLGPMAIRQHVAHRDTVPACVLTRAWLTWRPVPILQPPAEGRATWTRLGLVAVGTCLLWLLPALIGIGMRVATGRMPATTRFWRSSPRGVDLLSYLFNPNHPWLAERTNTG